MSEDLIAEAITEAFGERCPDYEATCWCCKAWQQYDDLKALATGNMMEVALATPLNKEEGAET